VYGKHIRLECPKNSGSMYYNYKNFFPLILIAICDSNYSNRRCRVLCGKESDCNVLKTSTSGKKLYSVSVNFPPDQCLPGDDNGVPQPFILDADEAFAALHKNLLRPFPGRTSNNNRRIFNYRLSRARQCIECSFGILSQKWRVFQTSMSVDPNVAVKITKACCVLHNVFPV
ncbi:uncharacterized protein LOC115034731, partial [Acyrthosiphon pisum]|uniref:DDE Tnp4 domain-containing protein n=1 Tax=Acyrthosiphon pisum TaxID=7029 RepID=A0A8R2JVL2_ACYPI